MTKNVLPIGTQSQNQPPPDFGAQRNILRHEAMEVITVKRILLQLVFSATTDAIEGKTRFLQTNIERIYKGGLNGGNGIPMSYNTLSPFSCTEQ